MSSVAEQHGMHGFGAAIRSLPDHGKKMETAFECLMADHDDFHTSCLMKLDVDQCKALLVKPRLPQCCKTLLLERVLNTSGAKGCDYLEASILTLFANSSDEARASGLGEGVCNHITDQLNLAQTRQVEIAHDLITTPHDKHHETFLKLFTLSQCRELFSKEGLKPCCKNVLRGLPANNPHDAFANAEVAALQ